MKIYFKVILPNMYEGIFFSQGKNDNSERDKSVSALITRINTGKYRDGKTKRRG